jgi:hypothetical protein
MSIRLDNASLAAHFLRGCPRIREHRLGEFDPLCTGPLWPKPPYLGTSRSARPRLPRPGFPAGEAPVWSASRKSAKIWQIAPPCRAHAAPRPCEALFVRLETPEREMASTSEASWALSGARSGRQANAGSGQEHLVVRLTNVMRPTGGWKQSRRSCLSHVEGLVNPIRKNNKGQNLPSLACRRIDSG